MPEINKKTSEIEQKKLYLCTPQSWSTHEGVPPICLFSVDFFVHFQTILLISSVKSMKKTKKVENG